MLKPTAEQERWGGGWRDCSSGRSQSSSSEAQRQDGVPCPPKPLHNPGRLEEREAGREWRRGRGLEQERRKNREDAGHVMETVVIFQVGK